MLSVELPDSTPLLQHAVFTPRVYLVPRTSGRLLIGATVEDRGFEEGVTAGGLLHLLEGAWRAMPAVESARVVETWCGFRPGSRDDAPMIGHRDERLLFATGHYRNGILLAPVTADAIAMTICDQAEPEWISAFAPARFDADFAGFSTTQVPNHAAY
jgi:glycine oxidase